MNEDGFNKGAADVENDPLFQELSDNIEKYNRRFSNKMKLIKKLDMSKSSETERNADQMNLAFKPVLNTLDDVEIYMVEHDSLNMFEFKFLAQAINGARGKMNELHEYMRDNIETDAVRERFLDDETREDMGLDVLVSPAMKGYYEERKKSFDQRERLVLHRLYDRVNQADKKEFKNFLNAEAPSLAFTLRKIEGGGSTRRPPEPPSSPTAA